MGFQAWVGGTIVGSNRTARLWLASVFIVLAAAATLYRALAEPSLGWRFTNPAFVNAFLAKLFSAEATLVTRGRLPFGVSLLVVAQR